MHDMFQLDNILKHEGSYPVIRINKDSKLICGFVVLPHGEFKKGDLVNIHPYKKKLRTGIYDSTKLRQILSKNVIDKDRSKFIKDLQNCFKIYDPKENSLEFIKLSKDDINIAIQKLFEAFELLSNNRTYPYVNRTYRRLCYHNRYDDYDDDDDDDDRYSCRYYNKNPSFSVITLDLEDYMN